MAIEILSVMKRRVNTTREEYLKLLLKEVEIGYANIDVDTLIKTGKSTMSKVDQRTGEFTIQQMTIKDVGDGGMKVDFKKSRQP